MARLFNGTSDAIQFNGWAGSLSFTDLTVLAVVNQTSLASNGKMAGIDAGGVRFLGTVTSDGTLEWYDGTNGRTSTTKLVAGEWYIVAFTKAAGTSTGRFHFYRYSTSSWTHENASGTSADFSGTAGGLGGFCSGADFNGAQNLSCAIDFAAVYQANLTDAQVVTAGLSQAEALGLLPIGAWRFDQATVTTVLDVGPSAYNQKAISGTSVAAASDFPYAARAAYTSLPMQKVA